MEMGKEEICREYRTAKNKKKQIIILAELNSCPADRIREILKEEGVYREPIPKVVKKPSKEKETALLPDAVCNALYTELGRLDSEIRHLEKQLAEKQGQYRNIADFIMGNAENG